MQERVPVPHADIHGPSVTLTGQRLAQPGGLEAGQLPEGRTASDRLVVMRHLLDALGWYPSSLRDDLEERPDVFGFLRTAEGDQEHGIDVAHGVTGVEEPRSCWPMGRRIGHQRADSSCTMSTSAMTWSTGVSLWMPCPRLKMCPGRPATASRISFTPRRISTGLASRTAGSRFPWTATSYPSRSHAAPISTRQSSPITSPPAAFIRRRSPGVAVPKWMTGTPGVRRSITLREWVST